MDTDEFSEEILYDYVFHYIVFQVIVGFSITGLQLSKDKIVESEISGHVINNRQDARKLYKLVVDYINETQEPEFAKNLTDSLTVNKFYMEK